MVEVGAPNLGVTARVIAEATRTSRFFRRDCRADGRLDSMVTAGVTENVTVGVTATVTKKVTVGVTERVTVGVTARVTAGSPFDSTSVFFEFTGCRD